MGIIQGLLTDTLQTIITKMNSNNNYLNVPRDYPGIIKPFAGGTGSVPSGALLCDGSAVSRSTYAKLFAVIGTNWGVGDGFTTFNIPNLKGRILAGYDASQGGFNNMGQTGGSPTHTNTLTEMFPHGHKARIGNTASGDGSGLLFSNTTGDGLVQIESSGNGQPYSIMNPYAVVNYLIVY
jgi:microcystin-dependent protein